MKQPEIVVWVFSIAAVFSGCVHQPERASAPLDARTTGFLRSIKAPEYSSEVFVESVPAVFRVAVLQAAQFHQAKRRWPESRSELEAHFGVSGTQPYQLKTQPDGSLALGWETAGGAWAPVVRLTPDYVVSYSLTPSLEAVNAVRAKQGHGSADGQAIGAGVGAVLPRK